MTVRKAIGMIAQIGFTTMVLGSCSAFYPRMEHSHEKGLTEAAVRLRRRVEVLATDIGERNCFRPSGLRRAARWIEEELVSLGYAVERQPVSFESSVFGCPAADAYNIVAELPGTSSSEDILVVGAHYDSKVATPGWHDHGPALADRPGTPGANDNGSGVAALLEIARFLSAAPRSRTVRLVAFVNEEPPFFQNAAAMGSRVFARSCRERKESKVRAIVLDAIGTFSAQPTAKRTRLSFLPALVGLPKRTDYIAFLGNRRSRGFMAECANTFEKASTVDLRTVAFPAVSRRVAWSDDWSFWQEGYEAFTVTDTAYLRADAYHELTDTPEKLDYETFASVVESLERVILSLLEPPDEGSRS